MMIKRLQKSLLIIFIFILTTVLSSCNIFTKKLDASTFDDFTDELFVSLIGNDEMTSNFLFENPESFGLTHYDPSLPSPSVSSVLNKVAINLYFGRIKNYDYNELNADQQMTYNVIIDLINYINSLSSDMSYLSNTYLGSYLGYQAQLPLLLVEYKFRNINDVNNYFTYLDLVPDTFKNYVDFENEKSANGFGMPDFVIDKVVSQCDNFISGIDNGTCFMETVINKKIDACDFLSNEQKTNYKKTNIEKINGPLRSGYDYVKINLPLLKEKGTNTMGLAYFKDKNGDSIGKNYYELLFKRTVGYDISVDSAIDYMENKLQGLFDELGRFQALAQTDINFKNTVTAIESSNNMLMKGTVDNQLALYKEMIKEDFPELTIEPEIQINYIDESMQDNFSPAAYMTSAIDNYESESIYLNPKSIYKITLNDDGSSNKELDGNYLYTTLAHEGLPGHLYQNVYFKVKDVNKVRKVLKCIGYTEGWAVYSELYSYNFLREELGNNVVDYLILKEQLNGCLYSLMDFGIHYEGWNPTEFYDFLNQYFGINNEESSLKAYQQIVEIPTNYQEYFFSYFKINDMYLNASKSDNFNIKEFHTLILDCGPAPLKYVEMKVREKYNY